jgi:hypothetical protein
MQSAQFTSTNEIKDKHLPTFEPTVGIKVIKKSEVTTIIISY